MLARQSSGLDLRTSAYECWISMIFTKNKTVLKFYLRLGEKDGGTQARVGRAAAAGLARPQPMDGATLHTFDLPHLSEEATIAYYQLPREGADTDSLLVLLVHGLGCQALSFDQPQLLQLRRLGTVIIPDLLGNGRSASPRGEEHYTMRAQAACIVLLLQQLRRRSAGTNVCLVGHSMGGPIVLAVAEALLSDQTASPRPRCILYSEPNIDGGDCFGSRPGARPGVDLISLDATRAAKVATCRHLVAESDGGGLLARMCAVRKQGVASLVLIGGMNKGRRTSERALLDVGFPCRWIAGAGHSQHIDNPEGFYTAVQDFVAQVMRARSWCARQPEPEPVPKLEQQPNRQQSVAKQMRKFEWFSSRLRAATHDAQIIDFNPTVRAAISLELNKASAGRDAATRGPGALTYSVEAQRWIGSTEYSALRMETIRSFETAAYAFKQKFASLLKLPDGVPLHQLHTLFHADQGSKGDRREKTAMLAPLRDPKARREFEDLYESFILHELAPIVSDAMGPECDTV